MTLSIDQHRLNSRKSKLWHWHVDGYWVPIRMSAGATLEEEIAWYSARGIEPVVREDETEPKEPPAHLKSRSDTLLSTRTGPHGDEHDDNILLDRNKLQNSNFKLCYGARDHSLKAIDPFDPGEYKGC
jgi:hypothetical protein